jgi:hypothetical protein
VSYDEFSDPSSSSGLDLKALLGTLLLVEPSEVIVGMVTSYGPSDAVRATVTELDGANPGQVTTDALIFPRVLQTQLKSKVGQKVLGRLGQGVPKAGQSAPWTLIAATDADKATARAYLAQRPAVADPAPAPAASPWGATAPAAAAAPAPSPWAQQQTAPAPF